MRAAIVQALEGLAEKGLPIGSVLVRDGVVLAAGHNCRVQEGNPMAHAEIRCLQNAGRRDFRGTTLYSTLMPCNLCAGAAIQFGVSRVVAGESHNFAGARAVMESHGIEVVDMDLPECKEMMEQFIRKNQGLWHEDIGKP